VQRTEAYYARIDRLEKAVKNAEEALSRAQQGYRRGAPD
jgi:outer membrane protein TolC